MSDAHDHLADDDDSCPQCGGEGGWASCVEDCCPYEGGEDACDDPLCWRRCSLCRGRGHVRPPADVRPDA